MLEQQIPERNFTQITRIEDVKRGDIIVFSGPASTGHIGFADEDNDASKTTITVWGQNQEYHYNQGLGCYEWYFTTAEWNKSYFLGAFRYKGWAQTEVSFDVNFTVDGIGKEYIDGIGNISVYVGGQIMTYQDKQHSSATTSYFDFCRNVPGGQEYDVGIRITNPAYWCAGTTVGSAHGTTSGTTSVTFDIRSSKPSSSIPDGDYMIVAAGYSDKSVFQYLDIQGSALLAADHDNVALCGPYSSLNPPSYDIWTVTYDQSSGFYKIRQKGTNMCLDIAGDGAAAGANVQVFTDNTQYNTHYWIIEQNGSDGYRIRARNSGQLLDIAGGAIENGTNVQQWPQNGTAAQKWLFIPFTPTQTIEEGRYILLYTPNNSYELDVAGDTGEINSNTPVQIWDDTAISQYNSFDFIKLSNGFYKVRHMASGMCLDVTGGKTAYKSTVAVHPDNGSIAQQWAVVENGNGYSLISRCNGYALDLANGDTTNGKQLEIYPRLGNDHQRWTFVQAERRIRYNAPDADGGIPSEQTKYYKNDLVLSTQIPTRAGYRFLYWEDLLSLNENLEADHYNLGDTYRADKALELYAVWQSVEYIITYDANGGKDAPGSQTVNGGTATLSSAEPSRQHYHFLGWATDSSATVAEYFPGSEYSGGTDITLYAVWAHVFDNLLVLPGSLTEIESEAFLNTNADAVVVPTTVTAIGENAFDDVAIYGFAGTEAETYAADNGLLFIPITDDWVLAEEVPDGATVKDEKWTYLLASSETIKSTETSVDGWTQAGFEWKQTGTGTHVYANFPGGFDTGNSLYNAYAKSALSASETATTKREVSNSTLKDYIYWHWCFTDYVEDSNRNVAVQDAKRYGVQTGSVYRDYIYFDAFETPTSLSTEGMTTSGLKSFDGMYSTYHHPEHNLPEYASWWWWRFEVRQQTYTDYQKEFTYVKDTSSIQESATEVLPQNGISNIQHWVKYEF